MRGRIPGPGLIERRDAAQATLDRFRVRPFGWGSADCVQMITFHLRQLGRVVLLSKGGRYTTALGAKRALTRAGFVTIGQALDAQGLAPIAPAAAIVGDIVMGGGEEARGDRFGAYGVMLTGGRILGYHEDLPCADVLEPVGLTRAWRV